MLDIMLHTGYEHPSLLWTSVASVLSFATGLGLGMNSDRLRSWAGLETDATTE